MTRADFLYKWFWYAMAALPVWMAEDLLFSRVTLWGVHPVLLPLAAAAVAVLEGPVGGTGFGLGIGLLCSAAWHDMGSLMVLLLALAGALIGAVAQYGLKQNYITCLLCSTALLGGMDLLRILSYLTQGSATLRVMLSVALPEIAVSLPFTIPIYLLFRLVWSRVGGSRLL